MKDERKKKKERRKIEKKKERRKKDVKKKECKRTHRHQECCLCIDARLLFQLCIQTEHDVLERGSLHLSIRLLGVFVW